MKNINSGFTLIELLVAITIFGIVSMSIFTVFYLVIDTNHKNDISRSVQENIKNLVEIIGEDLRKNTLYGVDNTTNNDCIEYGEGTDYATGSRICYGSGNIKLYLAYNLNKDSKDKLNELDVKDWKKIIDFEECKKNQCFLVKNDGEGKIMPLTNSWVNFKYFNFTLSKSSDEGLKLLTINFIIEPAKKKGVKYDIIKNNTIVFQTTFTERLFISN